MEYNENLLSGINFISEILTKDINTPPILENASFTIDSRFMHHESHVVFRLKKENTIDIFLYFMPNEIRVDINDCFEALDFSMKNITQQKDIIREWIIALLQCNVMQKQYGKSYNKYYFINSSGKVIKTITCRTGLTSLFFPRLFHKKVVYNYIPIYS